jgi:hypothetical protein
MGTPKPKQNKRDDFDYDEIIKTTSDHQKSLEEIQTQIQQIVQIVQPIIDKENFALYFRETIDSHIALNNAIAAVLKKLLLENPEIKRLIAKEVEKTDRKWVMARIKSIWGFIIAVLLIIVGAVVGHFIH